MPLHRHLTRLAVATAFCIPVVASAQTPQTLQTLPRFHAFYNLQHAILTGMAEQDCVSLDRDACFKMGIRAINAMEDASTTTIWMTGSYRFNASVHAGFTLDPGIYVKLPAMYDTANRRPCIAGFTTLKFGAHLQTRIALAYSSSAPNVPSRALSAYREETGTATSGVLGGVDIAYLQPFGPGLLQPYLHLYYSQASQRDHTSTSHSDKVVDSMTTRAGFRTVYALATQVHLSFNLYVERDLWQKIHVSQQQADHTDVYTVPVYSMQAMRFGTSLGARLMLADNAELTAFVTQFSQAFGTRQGTGAGVYYLQRF